MISGLWSVVCRGGLLAPRCLWLPLGLLVCVVTPAWPAEMNPMANTAGHARERIVELRAELARHDELYFKKAAPEISDADYDRLKRELVELERTNPGVAGDGASAAPALGDDRSGQFPTYRHRERMLSLSKSYSESELRAFDARSCRQLGRGDLEYLVEPKFDGLAISVTYENGKLVRAVTRGDGVEGDDVTANALTIQALPRELVRLTSDGRKTPVPDLIELRGEVYLSYTEFARTNREREEEGEEPYAHPRNLAAGTLKLLDSEEVAQRKLSIVFYGWGACLPVEAAPDSQRALLVQLRAWGLPTIDEPRVAHGADAMWRAVQVFGRERNRLPFPIDGAVVKLNSAADRRVLGATEQAPNWAMAYKFQPDRVVTQVRGITLQIGRTGVLTPVAELAPVRLGGSTIARATLHNRDEIMRRDIRIGDFVELEKAGEIIPMITEVVLTRRPATAVRYAFPENCPVCRMALVIEPGEAAVRCPNLDCPAQIRRRIEYFASKDGVAISGLGPATIGSMVDHGLAKSVADLYRLRREDLLKISGVGEKTADNLLTEIERSRRAELWRLINGLGIPRVGKITAKALAARFGSLSALARCSRAELLATSLQNKAAIGAATAESVLVFFGRPENQALVAALLHGGVNPPALGDVVPPMSIGFTGKVFVSTGNLPNLTRTDVNLRIAEVGGRVEEVVTANTDYVLVGQEAGAKLELARQLGIPLVDEDALLQMLGTD